MNQAKRRRLYRKQRTEGWTPIPTNKNSVFRSLDKTLKLLKAWDIPYTEDIKDDDNFTSRFIFTIPDYIANNPDKLRRFYAGEYPREEDKWQAAK